MNNPDDLIKMEEIGTKVPFKCPRCGYVRYSNPGDIFYCRKCMGEVFWKKLKEAGEENREGMKKVLERIFYKELTRDGGSA